MQQSLLAFTAAAALLTVTPGLDTALVLRAATARGRPAALLAGFGICLGCLSWGALVAVGLGTLLEASQLAYAFLKIVGAAYLIYLGISLIIGSSGSPQVSEGTVAATGWAWFRRGLFTNLLNPKVGVFYTAFLPQFIPAGADVTLFTLFLALIHAAIGLLWFVALTTMVAPACRFLQNPRVTRWLDRALGGLLVFLGLRLLATVRN